MRQRLTLLVLGSLVAVLSLAGLGSAAQKSAAKIPNGGTVIFGADQEPGQLNTFLIGGNAFWGSEIVSPTTVPSFRVHPNFAFVPELVSKATIKNNPFRITYYIQKKARWMDGQPVTAQDYLFTLQTIMNPNYKILSTTGYEDIKSSKVMGKKVVQFTFSKPFAGWRTLFGEILPQHQLQGADFNKIFINDLNDANGKPVSNGPYYLSSWERGKQATLLRNPKFWKARPHLDRVVYRFLPDTNTTATQVQSGEVDVIYPQPQPFLVPLRKNPALTTQIGKGPVWEHIDFNMGRGNPNPALAKDYVRQAIAYGIDRAALVKALYASTDIAPGLPVLNSPIYMTNSPFYKKHWGKYAYNKNKAIQLLQSNGCTRGGDGIFSCGGQKLSFRFSWTSGNQLRQLSFEIMQAQLKQVGIELRAADFPAGTLFRTKLPAGDYDIILFAWVGSPDVSGWVDIYGCRNDAANEGQDNNQGYCNPTVTKLLNLSNRIANDKAQAKVINAAIDLMSKDVPIIPLFQKPTYLIARKEIKGEVENPTSEGPVWNIQNWYRTKA